MKLKSPDDLKIILQHRIQNARRIAIIGIGDELLPFDCLGMFAARELEKLHLPDVNVFFAGTIPESITAPLRRFQPDHVILIDAADMGVRPGTISVLKPGRIQANLVSTHVLPLSVVIKFIAQDSKTRVTLLGIQPDISNSKKRLSESDREFLNQNLLVLSAFFRDRQFT
jgi:hydrogenase 3 maturation protease